MRRDFGPIVYVLPSQRNGTPYTGVTSDLMGRLYLHREGLVEGFTKRYGVKMLVRTALDDEARDSARKTDQEMESGVEAAADRGE